jgi:hypothetical protein
MRRKRMHVRDLHGELMRERHLRRACHDEMGVDAELAQDLERAAAERCDVYVTELKAAAVDTVAEAAERSGARLVWARNRPCARPGEDDLDAALMAVSR